MLKSKLRKKILKVREKINKKNIQIDFNQIIKLLKREKITKRIIGGYFPVNFEVDDLGLLKKFERKKFKIFEDFFSFLIVGFVCYIRPNRYGSKQFK